MEDLIDFTNSEELAARAYQGNAGPKRAYLHDGSVWMIKFPQSTRGFKGKHLPSYTTSPVSEYIGSQIYKIAGVPVHETVLGKFENKVVVGCKDFAVDSFLLDFHSAKNTLSEEFITGALGSSGHGERLSDALRVIERAKVFEPFREEIKQRFWDMFVIDAFIRNNDRNNGNWGVLVGRGYTKLAPVFDNGNAFFAKRNASLAEKRLADETLLKEDLRTGVSFFTDDNDNHIHALEYIASMENADCNDAVLRVVPKLDMDAILKMIDSIPEQARGLEVLSRSQKDFYKKLLETTYDEVLLPTAEKLTPKHSAVVVEQARTRELTPAQDIAGASEAAKAARQSSGIKEPKVR